MRRSSNNAARESMAMVSTDTPIRDVLRAMTGVRAGAAVVIARITNCSASSHTAIVRHFQSDSRMANDWSQT